MKVAAAFLLAFALTIPAAHAFADPVVIVVVPSERAPEPMGARSFEKLVTRLKKARFDADRVALIAAVASRNHFSVGQASRLLGALSFDSKKLEAFQSIAPSLVDPEDGWQLLDAFTFASSREQASAILDRL